MPLESIVNAQGILTVKLPEHLFSKRVMVSIQTITENLITPDTFLDIFTAADELNFPRRSHTELIKELRAFRVSE